MTPSQQHDRTQSLNREAILLGEAALDRLSTRRVAVIGLGGVGSWCAEALARAGVGRFLLVDAESYSLSNLNRQRFANLGTVNEPKALAAARELEQVMPGVEVDWLQEQITADSSLSWLAGCDYVVDAIDTVSAKIRLAVFCHEAGIPLIAAMGCGNKLDPEQIRLGDLAETHTDPLCRVMRKALRQRGIEHLKVVWSPEEPKRPCPEACIPDDTAFSRRETPGSVIWVTATAGLRLAAAAIKDLVELDASSDLVEQDESSNLIG